MPSTSAIALFVRGPGFGIMIAGTWREFVAAPAASLSLIPDGIDDDQAAAYLAGAGYLTGYLALKELAKFRPGQTVLARYFGLLKDKHARRAIVATIAFLAALPSYHER